MTPEMETAVKWQSHLPALLACIAVTHGPVLELGVGHFSTPHLHALCGALTIFTLQIVILAMSKLSGCYGIREYYTIFIHNAIIHIPRG